MEIRFAECRLDRERRRLWRADEEVHLSPKAFELLLALVDRRPAAVPKAELLETLWPGVVVEEANLPNLIRELRVGLGDLDRKILRTVQRFGYAFDARVVTGARADPERPLASLAHAGSSVLLPAGSYRLGRDPESPLPLDALSVSRFHARLVVGVEESSIEDLGSKNGVWVGGRRIRERTALGDREALRLGKVEIAWRQISSASTVTATARDLAAESGLGSAAGKRRPPKPEGG